MSFINKEIYRINDLLGKNENINVIYSQKNTKFGKQKYNNCRYNAFITLFYFVYSSYIKNIKDENCKLLIELNGLIIMLSKDVNDKNY